MRPTKLLLWLAALLLILNLVPLTALEIGANFQLGTLGFAQNRDETDDSFSGRRFLWGGAVFGSHNLSQSLSFEGGFYRDLILRNISYTLFNYNIEFLTLGVGPFFGFFNAASTILKSGISTSVRLDWPGTAFVALRADNSIGGRLVETGDYIQERNDLSAGFYVYNAICSFNIQNKRFTQKGSSVEVVDSLTDYSFQADLFQKNLPYRLKFTFAYQTLAKKFIDSSSDPHTLNSIILGLQADANLTNYLTLLLNLESSIYTFGQGQLLGISNPGPGGFLFRASTGFKINVDKLIGKR